MDRLRDARAFSLVEMLVVIAIILVIAGITYPLITSAKHAAKRATCMGNLHQLSVATLQYESDNDGVLPPHNPPIVGGRPNDPWSSDVLKSYGMTNDIYHCPERGSSRVYEAEADYTVRFGIYGKYVGETALTTFWRFVPEPSTVIAYCQWHLSSLQFGKGATSGFLNVLRHSGTVEKIKAGSVTIESNDWGKFGPTVDPETYEAYLRFPGEPFPPVLIPEKL